MKKGGKEKLKFLKRRREEKKRGRVGDDDEERGFGSNSGQIYVSHPLIHTQSIHTLYSLPMNKKGFDRNQSER